MYTHASTIQTHNGIHTFHCVRRDGPLLLNKHASTTHTVQHTTARRSFLPPNTDWYTTQYATQHCVTGVMALFFCGVILAHYNSYNLSKKSQVRACACVVMCVNVCVHVSAVSVFFVCPSFIHSSVVCPFSSPWLHPRPLLLLLVHHSQTFTTDCGGAHLQDPRDHCRILRLPLHVCTCVGHTCKACGVSVLLRER